ncbi:hypothetical protein D3C85_890450 [compost metagenome]
MNNVIDDSVNERYRRMAEGKKPKVESHDINWITPRRLGILFAVCLVMSVFFNGIT